MNALRARVGEGATAAVVDWVHSVQQVQLSTEVAHHVRRLLLDHITAAVVGAGTPSARAVRGVVAEMYPGSHATVVGGGRASAAGAALANGTAAHALDIDDGYTAGSVHPCAPTVPAVLAAAESAGADGETVLRAIAAGVELTCRVARAGHPATRAAGFHNTAIAGVIGAAAGVSVVLGLDRQTVASALGVAGSHAGGLFEFLGSGGEVKRLHAGKAARDGLLSAHLARAGVTGPATVLEGTNGYYHAFADDDWRPADLLEGLGSEWALLDTYIKIYPCCRHLHSAIDALLDLRARYGLDAGSVTGVRVETHSVAAAHSHTRCTSHIDAQMSMPFAVAVSLLDGQVGMEQFDRSHRESAAVVMLAQRVEVVADAALDARYPAERPARVTVRRDDGSELRAEVAQPRGEPSRPLDDAELETKLHLLAGPVLGAARAGRVVSGVWAMGSRAGDVKALMADLGDDTVMENR